MNDPQMQGASANGAGSGSTQSAGDLKSSVRGVAEQATAQGHERIDSTREATATTLEKLAEGVRGAASELERDGTVGNLSSYIVQMSESMTRVASGLREKSGDDLVHEVSRIARENPTVFVAGAVALGFGLTRFARASTHHEPSQSGRVSSDESGSDLAGTPNGAPATSSGASLSSAGRGGTQGAPVSAGATRSEAPSPGVTGGAAAASLSGSASGGGATPGASSLTSGGATTPGMSAGPGASLGIGAGDRDAKDANGGSNA